MQIHVDSFETLLKILKDSLKMQLDSHQFKLASIVVAAVAAAAVAVVD